MVKHSLTIFSQAFKVFNADIICLGKGPFPGILDTNVFRGGPFELRAALLAKRNFAVLALAFQGYQDLPKRADRFHLEYFEEGIDFLRQQPEVSMCNHSYVFLLILISK